MTQSKARQLAKYHKFTKNELYEMLVEVLDTYNDEYWKKASSVNSIFDNGYYFNQCRKWLDYDITKDDNGFSSEIITVRILQSFGKFTKIQLPKKVKQVVEIQGSEKPTL